MWIHCNEILPDPCAAIRHDEDIVGHSPGPEVVLQVDLVGDIETPLGLDFRWGRIDPLHPNAWMINMMTSYPNFTV